MLIVKIEEKDIQWRNDSLYHQDLKQAQQHPLYKKAAFGEI